MRRARITWFNLFCICLMLFLFKFFYLIKDNNNPLMQLCAGDKQTGVIVVLLFSIILSVVISKGILSIKKDSLTWGVILVLWIAEIVYSVLLYKGQTLIITLLASLYLLIFILSPVLIQHTSGNVNKYKIFIRTFVVFSIIWSVLLLLQSFAYNRLGVLFLNPSILQNEEGVIYIRNDLLRCGVNSTALALSFGLSYAVVISGKDGIERKFFGDYSLHCINMVVSFCAMVFVCQIRVLTAGILSIICIGLLFKKFKRRTTKIFLIFSLLVITGIFLISNNAFLTKYLSYDTAEKSFTARIAAFPYYWDIFLKHPILGIGVITGEDSYALKLLRGPMGLFYTSDCGLIGTIAKYGFIPLVIVFVRIKSLINVYRTRKYMNNRCILSLIFIATILVYCTTLSCFEVQSIYLLPVIEYIIWGIKCFA